MDENLKKILLYLTGGLFLISSLVVIPFTILDSKSRNWPTVDAVIKNAEVKGEHLGSDDPLYILDVEYEYHVGSQSYTSNNYGTHDRLDSKIERQMIDMKNNYPVGSSITVAYDPDKPEYALMYPGIVWYHMTGLSIVAFFGICFSLCLFIKGHSPDEVTSPGVTI